jgi:putative DNA primase/helicase
MARKKTEVDWPEPGDLGTGLPPVGRFTPDMFPEVFAEVIQGVAERLPAPPEYCVSAALVAICAVAQGILRIQTKRYDPESQFTPVASGALIGESGDAKSPTIRFFHRVLEGIEDQWSVEEGNAERVENAFIGRRLLLQDTTYMGAVKQLRAHRAGMALWRDELSGWLADMRDRKTRAFFFQAMDGDMPYIVDRATRGSTILRRPSLCVFGGIQPEKWQEGLRNEHGTLSNDGLVQRLLFAVYPDPALLAWRDEPPADFLRFKALFQGLSWQDPKQPLVLCFDGETQAYYLDWWQRLQERARMVDDPVLRAVLKKHAKMMPLVTGIFSYAEGCEYMTLPNAERATRVCEVYASHMARICSPWMSPFMELVKRIDEKLKNRTLGAGGSFTKRDLYRSLGGRENPDLTARRILDMLETVDHVRPVAWPQSVGRPSEVYLVNPRLWSER